MHWFWQVLIGLGAAVVLALVIAAMLRSTWRGRAGGAMAVLDEVFRPETHRAGAVAEAREQAGEQRPAARGRPGHR